MEIQSGAHARARADLVVFLRHIRTALGNAGYAALEQVWGDRRGVTAVFTAVILASLIAAIGLAVDGTRLVMVQSRLRTSVDAAALIAARDMYPPANLSADF